MAKHKILVIDDEQPTLNMFQLFLKAYGYEVLSADTGSRGLEIFEAESPSIVFTDIKMPGMDGLEVLDRIKGQSSETEVIVITGHGDMDLAVEALNHEATDFINKPIHRSALEAALRRAEQRLESETGTVISDNTQEKAFGIIDIEGNVNATSKKALLAAYEKLNAAEKEQILLRFHDNASINGAGIGILIQLLSGCRDRKQKVAISGITENYHQIFDMVGITRLAGIFPDEEEAKAYLLSG